jgi:hypothetical protein
MACLWMERARDIEAAPFFLSAGLLHDPMNSDWVTAGADCGASGESETYPAGS